MKVQVVELFAGVGGFRKGLEACSEVFETVWANQWEPSRKVQHAFNCYVAHFGESEKHINEDINVVKNSVPPHDLLVAGFPCQDYSVAKATAYAKGIEGDKGVLWWSILDVITIRQPRFILLENVDRILRSPSKQRGRDFGLILRSLHDSGYCVEWRVINAADYGGAQKRRRTFIFCFKKGEGLIAGVDIKNAHEYLRTTGFFAPIFPVRDSFTDGQIGSVVSKKLPKLQDVSDNFEFMFSKAGVMCEGEFYTTEHTPLYETPVTLREIREVGHVESRFFLQNSEDRWRFLKGAKKIERKNRDGGVYIFSEGKLPFPDNLDTPSRTILTGESSLSRTSHVIEDALTGKYRTLTPVECERLQGFPDNWTDTGMPEKFRYFCMGNALCVPLITRMGKRILEIF